MKQIMLAALFALSQSYETISSGTKSEIKVAECLAEKTNFYGAYSCGHCIKQKREFGPDGWEAYKKSYVECSDQGSNKEQQKCEQEKIIALPTWKFLDGKTETIIGYKPLEEIADIAGCK